MLKKVSLVAIVASTLISCGGYTEDQENAAKDFCDCMDQDTYGDFEINWIECDMQLTETYPKETFADDGWSLALEETCPSTAGEIAESE